MQFVARSASKPIGLFASDLDGTLMGKGGHISERVLAALATARSSGWEVVLATGRPWVATKPVLERYPELGGCWAVCSDGALLYGPYDENPVELRMVDMTGLVRLREELTDLLLVVEEVPGTFRTTQGLPPGEFDGPQIEADWGTVANFAGPRVHLRTKMSDIPGLIERIEALEVYQPVVYARDGHVWADVTVAGSSKASMLEVLRARLGIPREATVAAGDSWNDRGMFRWANIGAVTSDAPDEVKESADIVIPSCADDGVAVLLEKHLAVDPLLERAGVSETRGELGKGDTGT